MVNASKEIADEELPIFYNTELNMIMEKHAPQRTQRIALRPEQIWISDVQNNEQQVMGSIDNSVEKNIGYTSTG